MLEHSKKRVRFTNDIKVIHYEQVDESMLTNWMLVSLDRFRFQNRIKETQTVLDPVIIKFITEVSFKQNEC